jgi:hypothetical protein
MSADGRYFYDVHEVPNFARLCERFTGKALQSPYRSTVPLLSLVRHHPDQWQDFLALLGASPPRSIHFEYQVASAKPGANPSQTDVMVFSDHGVWALEVKWTEPRYATVAARLRKPESDGGDPRITLGGWLRYLQPYATGELTVESVSAVVYQVLHRASSACAAGTAGTLRPELVYLHFFPSPLASSATTQTYVYDLRALHNALGNPAGLSFSVVDWPLEALPAFQAIEHLDKRAQSSSAAVRAALCREPLFRFGQPEIIRI